MLVAKTPTRGRRFSHTELTYSLTVRQPIRINETRVIAETDSTVKLCIVSNRRFKCTNFINSVFLIFVLH